MRPWVRLSLRISTTRRPCWRPFVSSGRSAISTSDRLEDLHRNVLVGGRHLALPIEDYPGIETWGQANDHWIRVAPELGGEAVLRALGGAGLDAGRRQRVLFRHRDRCRHAVDRRPAGEPPRSAAERQTGADLRSRLPGRGGRCRAGGGLPRGAPRRGRRAAVGRAVLADPAARGPLDGEPDRLRALRRRCGGGGARGRAAGRRRARGWSTAARRSTPTPSA